MDTLQRIDRVKAFGGWVETYDHASAACRCTMRFAVYLPPQVQCGPVPAVYWLSGLTCTHENFIVKAGALRTAAELGLALIAADTSPRGAGIAGEDDHWDFGTGAGFYLNATQPPWAEHYRMDDYISKELPALIEAHFGFDPGRKSISGHSMGGHGALVLALRNPHLYRSVSAFAPLCAPLQCPWGEKAFSGYLGNDRTAWQAYDASCLVARSQQIMPLLIDQGEDDEFLQEQLMPELLRAACAKKGYPLTLRMHPGYDHSYYFIATFIDEHLRYHAAALKK